MCKNLMKLQNVKNLDTKRNLEIYAAIYFIIALRRYYKRWLKLKNFADPPEPDIYCQLNDTLIGLEVTHLYGSGRDARMLFGRSKDIEKTQEHRISHSLVPLNDRIPADLNRLLNEKATKKYSCTTWLLIRNAYPLWNRDDFENYISDIVVPGLVSRLD